MQRAALLGPSYNGAGEGSFDPSAGETLNLEGSPLIFIDWPPGGHPAGGIPESFLRFEFWASNFYCGGPGGAAGAVVRGG